jgi:hypothetical protein
LAWHDYGERFYGYWKKAVLTAQQIFNNLLPYLWLRPERAVWDSLELEAVSKILLPSLKSPSLEYGCTDGFNTFTMLGGKLSFECDDYIDIPDIQNDSENDVNKDFFSVMPNDYQPKIICSPKTQFDIGLSWKSSHLKRAERLGIYKKLSIMNFDIIESKKFQKFQTIWAPQLFWTNEKFIIEKLLDLQTMLNPKGNLITILPNENQIKENLIYKLKLPLLAERIIDNGISNNFCKNARSLKEWEYIFNKANLKIIEQNGFINPIANRFYQFGFRPMFRPLLKMHSILKTNSNQSFLKLKENWVDTVHQFVNPLISQNAIKLPSEKTLWTAYRLQRKS